MGKTKKTLEETGQPAEDKKLQEDNSNMPAAPESAKEELDTPAEDAGVEKESECMAEKKYEIVCRNPINEAFGGVRFHEGTAHTSNGFTASWFNNKEGYTVREV